MQALLALFQVNPEGQTQRSSPSLLRVKVLFGYFILQLASSSSDRACSVMQALLALFQINPEVQTQRSWPSSLRVNVLFGYFV